MALPDSILGVLFRPGETFERARTEMRFSYWWILLSVLTLESVLLAYSPAVQKMIPQPAVGDVAANLMFFLLEIFATQAVCLFGVGRLFGWQVTLLEAMKYSGLIWSIFLLEDMVTFYSFLREQNLLLFWVSLPFLLWRLIAQSAGVYRVSGLPFWKAALVVFLATLPWQAPLLYQNWANLFR